MPTINKHHGSFNVKPKTRAWRYIVMHYTAGTGGALNNCRYFAVANRNASAHYFVDDSGIWEYADPDVYYTWHCGDGKGAYGISNANSIGIEVVVPDDRPYSAAEISHAAWLVVQLQAKYGIPSSNVVRHYDASRKLCPLYYAKRPEEWTKLRSMLTTGSTSEAATSPAPTYVATGGDEDVRDLQKWLNDGYDAALDVDGLWGPKTKWACVKALQHELNAQFGKGLVEDGLWGKKTSAACVNVKRTAKGNLTKLLQGILMVKGYDTGGFDGIFGDKTESAVIKWQAKCGLRQDGIAGKNTWGSLLA